MLIQHMHGLTSSATKLYAPGRNKWSGNYDEAKLKVRRENTRGETTEGEDTEGEQEMSTFKDFQYRRAVFLTVTVPTVR
jgi:hypothetical protein